MVKQIELEIRGTTFVANLIQEKAPITCKTILSILPFEGDGIHQSWSGPALMIHSPILSQAIKQHGLWPDPYYPTFKENSSIIGCPGELALYPVGGSICIAYGKVIYGGSIGPENSYAFAKINDNLDVLHKIGYTFREEGSQKIKIRLKKEDK